MSDSSRPPAVQECPASLGSKDADDFIEQQGELLPHNAPASMADDKPTEIPDPKVDSKEQATETLTNTLVTTTPPPNDTKDWELYSGDREVVFIGAFCVKTSWAVLYLKCNWNSGSWDGGHR